VRLPLGRELEAERLRSRQPRKRERCGQVARNDTNVDFLRVRQAYLKEISITAIIMCVNERIGAWRTYFFEMNKKKGERGKAFKKQESLFSRILPEPLYRYLLTV
jgi:hypothetical protein